MEIAKTILAQLGGNKFVVMTGARNMLATERGLRFNLPARFAKSGINCVEVNLDRGRDTYEMRFLKIGPRPGRKLSVVEEIADVYSADMQRIFTQTTGLDTSL